MNILYISIIRGFFFAHRVDLRVISMKRYSTLSRSTELELHYQMQFSVISKTPLFSRSERKSYCLYKPAKNSDILLLGLLNIFLSQVSDKCNLITIGWRVQIIGHHFSIQNIHPHYFLCSPNPTTQIHVLIHLIIRWKCFIIIKEKKNQKLTIINHLILV